MQAPLEIVTTPSQELDQLRFRLRALLVDDSQCFMQFALTCSPEM